MIAYCLASKRFISVLSVSGCFALASIPVSTALAQDSAFLACSEHRDRGQRIACLEDALEDAMGEAASVPLVPSAPAGSGPVPAAPVTESSSSAAGDSAQTGGVTAEDSSASTARLDTFGQQEPASVSNDAEGQEQLHDTITTLEKRGNLWLVTLSSGQVWMQEVPRRLNLREGDAVTIYQGGFGSGYRLSAKSLSGFIRVERVR